MMQGLQSAGLEEREGGNPLSKNEEGDVLGGH